MARLAGQVLREGFDPKHARGELIAVKIGELPQGDVAVRAVALDAEAPAV